MTVYRSVASAAKVEVRPEAPPEEPAVSIEDSAASIWRLSVSPHRSGSSTSHRAWSRRATRRPDRAWELPAVERVLWGGTTRRRCRAADEQGPASRHRP